MSPRGHSPLTTHSLVCLLSAGLAFGASANTVMTSATGNVTVDGKLVGQNDSIGAGDTIEVEGNSKASVLVGDTAIVKMCHGAALGFGADSGGGPSALNLRSGQVKVSAGKRSAGDPLEIHTPAAIATLLGTEVHVAVDRDSGDTVITSIDHQIRVKGTAEDAGDGVVISPGEKITISAGGVPGEVEQVDSASFANSSDCLDDARFRVAAVKAAVRQYADKSIAVIAMMDSEVDVPQVAAGPPMIPTGTLGAPAVIPPCQAAAQCAGVVPYGPYKTKPAVPSGIPPGP